MDRTFLAGAVAFAGAVEYVKTRTGVRRDEIEDSFM